MGTPGYNQTLESMSLTLDIGCGQNKRPGSIGIDSNPSTDADVLADINNKALPFRDGSFQTVYLIHVIEHVGNVIHAMEEAHRVLQSGGRLLLETPHYSDSSSFTDPTHRWHLNTFSFQYFTKSGGFSYYSPCRFEQIRIRIKLLRFWRLLGLELAVNHSRTIRKFWEYYLCFLIRGKVMTVELEAVK